MFADERLKMLCDNLVIGNAQKIIHFIPFGLFQILKEYEITVIHLLADGMTQFWCDCDKNVIIISAPAFAQAVSTRT